MTDKNLENIVNTKDTSKILCDELSYANSEAKESETRGYFLAEKYIELLEEENLMESFSFSRKYFNANSENYLSGVAKESFNSKMREYYASKIDGGDYSA